MGLEVIQGEAVKTVRGLPAASIDACVTDPPYELNFMGKGWDNAGVSLSPDTWRAVYDSLKDGGRLLAFGGTRTYHRIVCAIEDAGFTIEDCIMWVYASGFPKHRSKLKPAYEPVVVARKGRASYLNIDACRIGAGRWPANVILDGVSGALLDRQSGDVKGAVSNGKRAGTGYRANYGGMAQVRSYADSGGASRFFYCAKASRKERGEGNTHPTVKPLTLTRYLVRLVTPPGGVVLDPFAGSGTTGVACALEGFNFTGIEYETEHVETARRRIAEVLDARPLLSEAVA